MGVGRILAIDYGLKRCGFAWSDENQQIAFAIEGCLTDNIVNYLQGIFESENIHSIVLGYPLRLNGSPTHITSSVENFQTFLLKKFPVTPVKLWDERYTTKIAMDSLVLSNVKKLKRKNKLLLDSQSATILLQNYLEYIK